MDIDTVTTVNTVDTVDCSGDTPPIQLLHEQPVSPRPNQLQILSNRFPPYTRINADVLMKLIMLGDTGVGKTAYLQTLMREKTPQYTTIGVDMVVKYAMLYPEELLLKTNIWDTAGQEAFRSILSAYYRTVCGGFYVFDTARPETFHNLKEWIQSSRAILPPTSHNHFMVLGIIDVDKKRCVSRNEGKSFALDYGLYYSECSPKKGLGVDESFMKLIQWIWRTHTPETVGIRLLEDQEGKEEDQERLCCPLV